MNFSSPEVNEVFLQYEKRNTEERAKIAVLGSKLSEHRDEFLYPWGDEGIVAADNMIEPVFVREDARKYRTAVGSLPDMQTALLPIGSGIELSVKWSSVNRKL